MARRVNGRLNIPVKIKISGYVLLSSKYFCGYRRVRSRFECLKLEDLYGPLDPHQLKHKPPYISLLYFTTILHTNFG
jgi:hypothetical protein